MGLDIEVHTGLQRIECSSPEPCIVSRDAHETLYNMGAFSDRAADLGCEPLSSGYVSHGCYHATLAAGFPAGSYSGYNRFRRALWGLVADVPVETLWGAYGVYQNTPFAPMVHFADNEGTLGPKVCQRLARDFALHRDTAERGFGRVDDPDEALHMLHTYQRFDAGFQTAAAYGGVLVWT